MDTIEKLVVDGLPGGRREFAADEPHLVRDAILEYVARKTDDEEGSIEICWYAEDVPVKIFDRLVTEYADNPHGIITANDDLYAEWNLDSDARYLLVEENIRGGYWLSCDDSFETLMENHINQEYAEEWELVALYDCTTGDEVSVEVSTTFAVKS